MISSFQFPVAKLLSVATRTYVRRRRIVTLRKKRLAALKKAILEGDELCLILFDTLPISRFFKRVCVSVSFLAYRFVDF